MLEITNLRATEHLKETYSVISHKELMIECVSLGCIVMNYNGHGKMIYEKLLVYVVKLDMELNL